MEKVITVSLQTPKYSDAETQASLEELCRLVHTAGGRVVETHRQKRDRPDPASFIGRGKAALLAQRARDLQVRAVVFDEELKPVQQRNLEDLLQVKVVDRTRLILDIFAQRARTREGILQVELAQLQYRLPRLTGTGIFLDSQTGGIGTRGPGERKLEIDRRRIRERIALLQKHIGKIREERQLQRAMRRSVPVPQVALVGYTNAGKSTLLNAFLRQSHRGAPGTAPVVYADDQLFATLDPTTRRVRLPSGKVILVSDTVGFIRKLPTELIAAFRATLEEIGTADLLLHVVDASDPDWAAQARAVEALLSELDLGALPRLTAYNKMDRLSDRKKRAFMRFHGWCLSAQNGQGVPALLEAVEKALAAQWVEANLMFSFHDGGSLSRAHHAMEVLSQQVRPNGIRVRVRAHPATLAQWQPFLERGS